MSIPVSQFIPLPLPLVNHKIVFYFCFVDKFIYTLI